MGSRFIKSQSPLQIQSAYHLPDDQDSFKIVNCMQIFLARFPLYRPSIAACSNETRKQVQHSLVRRTGIKTTL